MTADIACLIIMDAKLRGWKVVVHRGNGAYTIYLDDEKHLVPVRHVLVKWSMPRWRQNETEEIPPDVAMQYVRQQWGKRKMRNKNKEKWFMKEFGYEQE